MYQLDIAKQTITINGDVFSSEAFNDNKLSEFGTDLFKRDLFLFLQDWFSESPYLTLRTSGSTGTPKEIRVEKDRMMQSARLTCSFLDLSKGDTALLCMSLDYIAGKMLVVRALVAGLNLYYVTPDGNPLKEIDIPLSFAAMIPLQVYNSLRSDIERQRMSKIENLIIGGGAIDIELANELKSFPNKIYSTYGMTETLSHIAMRKLNGNDSSEYYSPFASVSLSLSDDRTLIIDAPLVSHERIYTNDIAEINNDGSFRIIGRKDNIINSGGIKIQIEELESLLKPILKCPFAITSRSDSKFGEIVVLVVEGDIDEVSILLPYYYIPKKIIKVSSIPLTETGKINRHALKELVKVK